jgi:hypothetical protein
MRVNVYAEEMTDRVEIISKEIDGQTFTGLRLYLYLPVTKPATTTHVSGTVEHRVQQLRGPFLHHDGDDDSAAITFWGKRDLRDVLDVMRHALDEHYKARGHG